MGTRDRSPDGAVRQPPPDERLSKAGNSGVNPSRTAL